MVNPLFRKAVIIGVGLLGGSLVRDLRKHVLAETIVGVCRSQSSQKSVSGLALLDEVIGMEQLSAALENADLIVLAVPMQAMKGVLTEISQANTLDADCIITDVGSVKLHLQELIEKQFPDLQSHVVLAHPIAGAEKSGAEASREGLFKNKHVILTPNKKNNDEQIARVRDLWEQVGADVLEMDAMQHDVIFSKTSHLPHMVAYALVNFLAEQEDSETLFDMAASGFYDFTRIASSDSVMWRDICLTNKQQILNAISGYRQSLDALEKIIEQQDTDQLSDFFDRAKSARNTGLDKKGLN